MDLEDRVIFWRPSGEVWISIAACSSQLEKYVVVQQFDLHPVVPEPLASDLWDLQSDGMSATSAPMTVVSTAEHVNTNIVFDCLLEVAIEVEPRLAWCPV